MAENFTWEEVKEKLNKEIDIAVFLEDVFTKKWYDPNAMINEFLLNGETDFEYDPKSSYTMMVCPFHNTKKMNSTMSYHDKNTVFCKTGDCPSHGQSFSIIDLYMVLCMNIDPDLLYADKEEYKKAVKELCERYKIPFDYATRKLTDEEKKELKKQQIRQEVAEIYHKEFLKNNDYARKAREYFFHERGFKYAKNLRQVIRKFKIGYAGGKYGSQYVYNRLKKKYSDEELVYAGVVAYKTEKKDGKKVTTNKVMDFLTNRLTIPYFYQNKINNCYGRNMNKESDSKHLRYKGIVEIPVNWDEAKKHKEIILVEGEMDWLSLIAVGYSNVIGVGGTGGLGKEDLDLLEHTRIQTKGNKCQTIYFCFDEDGPGQTAMMKLGPLLLERNFDVRVVCLTEGDPNDYLRKYKQDARTKFDELFSDAISYDCFAALYQIKKMKLHSDADKRAAVVALGQYFKKMDKMELLFVAPQIAKPLGIPTEWVLASWGLFPASTEVVPEIVGLEKACQKPWFILTTSKERYEAILKNGLIDNVVFTSNVPAMVEKLKTFNAENNHRIANMVYDHVLSQDEKEFLQLSLKGFRFQEFNANSIEQIINASKYELISMFIKVPFTQKAI